ncbi:GNAT family N-acetyltransferase [archaeon]|nr:GNAT family N-acetyltransferase [archaeon]
METKDTFIIKRLSSDYRDKVLEHFLRLDYDSVYSRFCTVLKETGIKTYVSKIDFEANGIFGVFDSNLNVVGVGECVLDEKNNKAEVGFSVESNYQGNGLGSKLMVRMVRFAKSRNKMQLEMLCLRTNTKSLHLAKKFGLKVINNDGGEILAIIPTKNDSPEFENLNEQIEDTFAYYAIKQKEQINSWKNKQDMFKNRLTKVVDSTLEAMKPRFFF